MNPMPPKLIQFCTAMDNPEFNAMDFDAPNSISKDNMDTLEIKTLLVK